MKDESKHEDQKYKHLVVEIPRKDCTSLSPEDISHLIITFLSHLMYIREQSPLPLSRNRSTIPETENMNITTERQPRRSIAQRKQEKVKANFQLLCDGIEAICVNYVIRTAVVSIGPTLTSPREIYLLKFTSSEGAELVLAPMAELSLHASGPHARRDPRIYSRRLVRTLVSHWSEATLGRIPLTNTFVALDVSPRHGPSDAAHGPGSLLSFGPSAANVFMPREGFRLRCKSRRHSPLPLCVTVTMSTSARPPVQGSETAGADASPSQRESEPAPRTVGAQQCLSLEVEDGRAVGTKSNLKGQAGTNLHTHTHTNMDVDVEGRCPPPRPTNAMVAVSSLPQQAIAAAEASVPAVSSFWLVSRRGIRGLAPDK